MTLNIYVVSFFSPESIQVSSFIGNTGTELYINDNYIGCPEKRHRCMYTKTSLILMVCETRVCLGVGKNGTMGSGSGGPDGTVDGRQVGEGMGSSLSGGIGCKEGTGEGSREGE